LAARSYTYDPFNYLVLSVPPAADCEWDASLEELVLVVAIDVEPAKCSSRLTSPCRREAFALAEEGVFDLLLLDVHLPELAASRSSKRFGSASGPWGDISPSLP
jgi:hypothetical protein